MENIIGKNLALGIGKGFEENIGKVNEQIQNAIKPSVDVDVNANGVSNGRGKAVVINQTNNYSAAHSRYEIYKSKQQFTKFKQKTLFRWMFNFPDKVFLLYNLLINTISED